MFCNLLVACQLVDAGESFLVWAVGEVAPERPGVLFEMRSKDGNTVRNGFIECMRLHNLG
jgi:hypothetical protein